MPRIVARHSRPTRLMHWINAFVLGVMAWSGISISSAEPPFKLSIGGRTILTFFPRGLFDDLSTPYLETSIAWHFTFAWLLVLNGLLYLGWTAVSGSWRAIVPGRGSLREAGRVLWHDLGFSERPPARAGFYNGAQRIAYSIAILMGIGLVVTGLAIFRPVQLGWLTRALGGYQMARAEHFWLTMAMLAFVAIHVIQAVHAGWNVLRSMIVGFEVVGDEEAGRGPS